MSPTFGVPQSTAESSSAGDVVPVEFVFRYQLPEYPIHLVLCALESKE